MVRALQYFFFRRMSSKKERIAELETIVAELKQENKELNDAMNAILLDIRDLQQFKRFVELSRSSQNYVNVPTLAMNTTKA